MTAARVHELRTWPEPFEAMLDGRKRFELRRDDRGFAVGDELCLLEWDPTVTVYSGDGQEHYTGRKMRARVTYILHGGRFGLPSELCVIGIEVLP